MQGFHAYITMQYKRTESQFLHAASLHRGVVAQNLASSQLRDVDVDMQLFFFVSVVSAVCVRHMADSRLPGCLVSV